MSAIPPVRKQVVVEASRERAFELFTAGIDRWWPREHHIGASPLKQAIIEPRRGGRWYAVCQDGTECETGKVLVWEPPARLVLAWQLTAQWTYDPSLVTEVEVTFTAEAPRRTRVDLEHRNMERFGVTAVAHRKAMDGPTAWELTLRLFAAVAADGSDTERANA